MHAFTSETAYPDDSISIPTAFITLLDTFFQVVDKLAASPTESQRFADIFAADGVWKTPSAAFKGREQLTTSGSDWAFLREIESMRHYVRRVYASDREGREIMLSGWIRVVTKEGETVDVDFGARVEIDKGAETLSSEPESKRPRLQFFQGWSARV